jgi:hypothetical protein
MNLSIDDAEQPLPDAKMEQAVFGEEVRRFLQEDRIGRYITAKAAQQTESGLLELKDIDPEDAKAIRAIQTKIRVAESVVSWLAEAIDNGERAQQILEDEG